MKVAISGHQNLGDCEAKNWIRTELELSISQLNVEVGFCCLAVGADQMFADIIVRNNIPLVAIIPCLNYEITFDENHIDDYKILFNKAAKIIQLKYKQPTETAFFEGSKFMLKNCDILIAVWDNQPSKGLGGTADVVNMAIGNKIKILHINPITRTTKLL